MVPVPASVLLLGIALAIPFAAAQSTDVLNIAPAWIAAPFAGLPVTMMQILGLAGFGFFVTWMYRVAKRTT